MSTYQQYKECTGSFIQWIGKFSEKCNPKTKQLPNELGALFIRVKAITSSRPIYPTEIGEAFQKEVERVLKHGERAVELRSLVHSMYEGNKEDEQLQRENDKHFHCILVLKKCLERLKDWYQEIILRQVSAGSASPFPPSSTGKGSGTIPQNLTELAMKKEFALDEKFRGLQLDDDFEDVNRMTEEDILNLPLSSTKQDHLNIEELDLKYGELKLRFVCFLLDLISLEKTVMMVWKRVKDLEISVLAATAATYTAIRQIRVVENQISLLYSTYRHSSHFFAALQSFCTKEEFDWIQHQPTYILLNSIKGTLNLVGNGMHPGPLRESLIYIVPNRGGGYCEIYNESTKPPLVDDEHGLILQAFLNTEISTLYYAFKCQMDGSDRTRLLRFFDGEYKMSMIALFVNDFLNFFDHRGASMTLIFTIVCWIRSLQALEDKNTLFMYKTIYLCRSYQHKRLRNYQKYQAQFDYFQQCYNHPNVAKIFNSSIRRYELEDELNCMACFRSFNIQHNHPYLAGAHLLEWIYIDHCNASAAMECSSLNHLIICFMYRIFREQGILMEPIPCLELFLNIFQESLFHEGGKSFPTPKKDEEGGDQHHHLEYYFLSRGETLSSINKFKAIAIIQDRVRSTLNYCYGLKKKPVEVKMRPKRCSKLYSALIYDDFQYLLNSASASLPENNANNMSYDEVIDEIVSQVEEELFSTRYLSMDLFLYVILFDKFFTTLVQSLPILQQWFAREMSFIQTNATGNIIPVINERFLIPFILEYFDTPVNRRSAQSKEIIENIALIMKDFFTSAATDDLLTIPNLPLQEIYRQEFGLSFHPGLHHLEVAESSLTDLIQQRSYFTLLSKCRRLSEQQVISFEEKQELIKEVKSFIQEHVHLVIEIECKDMVLGFIYYYCFDPQLKDRDVAEWLFVTYGCSAHFQLLEKKKRTYLVQAAETGNAWAMDMFASVTSAYPFHWQDHDTGYNILHILAKAGHYDLLDYILDFGLYTEETDHQNQLYTDYVKHPEIKKYLEEKFQLWMRGMERILTILEGEPIDPEPYRRHAEHQRSYIKQSLETDAINELSVTANLKNKKNRKKAITSIEKEITKEDEEQAKEAERQLLEMIVKEEQEDEAKKEKKKKLKKDKKKDQLSSSSKAKKNKIKK